MWEQSGLNCGKLENIGPPKGMHIHFKLDAYQAKPVCGQPVLNTYSFGFFSPVVLELPLRSSTAFSTLNDTGLIQFTHLELGAGIKLTLYFLVFFGY